ncbi:MAG: thiol reductase thioredoxin [Spirochaetae bacterium HGW-Spirochaetae-3]|jgi:ribonucleoside-triphosphate reductase|nr:MAG: thiol reductase thioredoxin [Spirochaetae bacterium HGW-Spirochaetae-3]
MIAIESKEARLAQLKAELLTVEGTPTEVYSRIVGYYRSVRNWNAGKREEFGKRKEFSFPSTARAAETRDTVSYMLFSRAACPNCPPVKEYLGASGLPGVVVDVDTDEGLDLARRYEVLSTPTAILLGADGSQVSRAHSRRQLEPLIQPVVKGALEASIA